MRWLISEVEPDFRTIANFRKDNAQALINVFHAFNSLLRGKVENEYLSVDGSKFLASNSRERNFTLSKLDDRISWLEGHIGEYLRLLDEADKDEEDVHPGSLSKEELDAKVREAEEHLARYRSYRKKMEDEDLSQLSLTDPDSRLMKTQNGFDVSYNIQTAVSSKTHMIADFNVTSDVTDYGQLKPSLAAYKQEQRPDGILEAVADKGYQSEQDMRECLESGIIPHVILPDGKDTYEIETPYEEAKDCDPSSTKPEDLKKCLRAGIIPKAYEGVIESAVVTTKKVKERSETAGPKTSPFSTSEEMKEKAAEGRDAE